MTLETELDKIIHLADGLRTTDAERDASINAIIEEVRSLINLAKTDPETVYKAIDELSPELDKLASNVNYQGDRARFGTRETLPEVIVEPKSGKFKIL